MQDIIIILGIITIVLIGYILYLIRKELLIRASYTRIIQELQETLDSKAKSTASQRATIKGQLAEQFWPIMRSCPFAPSDMRFLGDFCDYIVADGYGQCKDSGADYIENIVFVEIKTGKSQLSRHQKLIRNAVQEGRVRWETITL